MYRIALSKMLFLVRLVIVVSLAGYNMSYASAAMHGTIVPDLEKSVSSPMQHGEHDVAQASDRGHAHSGAADSDDDDAKIVKQECCKDFCGGFGIMCDGHNVGGPVVTSVRQFVDDQRTFGELPTLDRPPNI
ncbi:hypothetical protein [Rhizobium sp. P44RR-XXIV]|uniref:hypothetical protein n=1 Tax=unclassified Rhizobium TaxID=2613769 RepID=UPI00098420C5|nr:hypothetical protein [Rhizobium sp. P44RR-XXIV]TIX93125.1 hypothetical protein BSK43_002210 [Rhizobium sp. P44RR-XXIV]